MIDEDKLKTVPRGFPKDFEFADLLKLKHYLVKYDLNPAVLESEDFSQQVSHILKQAYPFNKFFNYTVDEVMNS